jgi:hypothetical protein
MPKTVNQKMVPGVMTKMLANVTRPAVASQ